jgi:hypothetical protein
MEAGRELDALVAEDVMRLRVCRDYGFRGNHVVVNDLGIVIAEIARYSTDIAAAWQIVEYFYRAGWGAGAEMDGHTGCRAFVGQFTAEADTAPFAICLAALLAVRAL